MKKRMIAGIFILMCVLAAGIGGFLVFADREEESGLVIYGVNMEGTALEEIPYDLEGAVDAEAVGKMLEALVDPKDAEIQPAIPKSVGVRSYELEGEKVTVDFTSAYGEMDTVREVMCRAAVVRSLTQIDHVDMVKILVEGSPLTNEKGEEYGFMQQDDFVQNTGSAINSFEETRLSLYFADESGTKLVKEIRKVRYNTSLSKEKLVVEQLMKGPQRQGYQGVIPEGTKLLDVSVKDDVCYVNFDEGINKSLTGVAPEVTIYAIVNSITDSTTEGQVQISVDGETNKEFQESVEIGHPLTRNPRILEAGHND